MISSFFISCGGAPAKIASLSDETLQSDEEQTDVENREEPDKDAGTTDENRDSESVQDAENPAAGDDDPAEIPDEDKAVDNDREDLTDSGDEPINDSVPETPDESTEPETPDEGSEPGTPDEDSGHVDPDDVWSVCGVEFSGANCIASSCESVDDCCGADICVSTAACGGAKVCRNAFFRENFDSYTAASFPPNSSGWKLKYAGKGQWYQIVTPELYVSPENSMHLLGSKSSNLSAVMTAALPQVPDVINVEMQMNTQGDNVAFSLCTFENEAAGQNWGNYDMKVEFADGKIRYQIPEWHAYEIAPSYEANRWYKIRLKLDQINKTVSVWVDDELKVNNQAASFDSISIPNICLVSDKNDKKVWFDDIFVWGE